MASLKKFLLVTAIFAVFTAVFSLYAIYNFRKAERASRQDAKAEEINVTIIEGWTADDIAGHLDFDKNRTALTHILHAADFLKAEKTFDTSRYPLLDSKPKTADLEGFLFPDTYRFLKKDLEAGDSTPGQVSREIIKKMLDNFSAKFTVQMEQQAKNLNMSVYEIITVASIIEKETGRNAVTAQDKTKLLDERKMVASVFYNRLRIGQPLQSDATVNFFTGKNDAQATLKDTQTANPYNTYKYPGLPPGPISNPSLSSITAALNPATSDYYYFLHRRDTGEAVFSKTYDEHLKNKAKYLE